VVSSSSHFRVLRREMTRIEDRVTAARRFYNLAVEELNTVRRAFPGNLIAVVSTIGTYEKFSLGERQGEFAEPVKIGF
jgi:LemA protein